MLILRPTKEPLVPTRGGIGAEGLLDRLVRTRLRCQ
jgi:hypothetical protein